MNHPSRKTIYLSEYIPPAYLVDTVDLHFDLEETATVVQSRLRLRRTVADPVPLVLEGQGFVLRRLLLEGHALCDDAYTVGPESLVIHQVPAAFTLEIETLLCPRENTALEGLYASSGNLCTQCEPEGFRRMTYYLDRPDVMALFTTTLVADPRRYPVLLSNGNPAGAGTLPDGRHYARWVDPFPKPSYLFALVAGDLACVRDTYLTSVGKQVDLRIYVQPQNQDQCAHALASLKKAIQWDEQVYGCVYDLEVYQIVAVDDFNMGAMENKGLNVFNSRYVLAQPETATDDDFEAVEAIIAHEYFHNWSGNRVTCRDWFQLSLKEGLTVFRDQEFTADRTSRPVKRIKDVQRLRTSQFREDAGPLAHPVRPDSYMEINNFYTTTVYDKGAEVVRMAYQLLQPACFRRATDLYFARHDGQAVTTEDFVRVLEEASQRDLTQFRRWYTQAGTPILRCQGEYDAAAHTYTLTVQQECPPTPGQPTKEPFHIPFAVGLLDWDGQEFPLRLADDPTPFPAGTRILELRTSCEVFRFEQIPSQPIPSLLRGFSAPVKLNIAYSNDELALLLSQDSDWFNRWEAGQQLALRLIKGLLEEAAAGRPFGAPTALVTAYARLLSGEDGNDPRFLAEALTIPSEGYLAEQILPIDPGAIHAARSFVREALARTLRPVFLATYHAHAMDQQDRGKRRLKNLCLGYLMELADDEARSLCMTQFQTATNMTDAIAALSFLANTDCPERPLALATFYERWNKHAVVLDKWFSIQAMSRLPSTLETVRDLIQHPDFRITNPNKVYATLGAFCHSNPNRFHAPDGSGYAFLTEQVLILDPMNPQVAARLIKALADWRRYEPLRCAGMREALERIVAQPKVSNDVHEIALKSLGDA